MAPNKYSGQLLDANGYSNFSEVAADLELFALDKEGTQMFGKPADELYVQFPTKETITNAAKLKAALHEFEARGIDSQTAFEIQDQLLYANLARVVAQCSWATDILYLEQNNRHYAKSMVALTKWVFDSNRGTYTINLRQKIQETFDNLCEEGPVPEALMSIKTLNGKIKRAKEEGAPFTDIDLLLNLRKRLRAIPTLVETERNSHIPALKLGTWEALSQHLIATIVSNKHNDEVDNNLTQRLHGLALSQGRFTQEQNCRQVHAVTRYTCFKCGSPHHISRDCEKPVKCSLCPPGTHKGWVISETHATEYHSAHALNEKRRAELHNKRRNDHKITTRHDHDGQRNTYHNDGQRNSYPRDINRNRNSNRENNRDNNQNQRDNNRQHNQHYRDNNNHHYRDNNNQQGRDNNNQQGRGNNQHRRDGYSNHHRHINVASHHPQSNDEHRYVHAANSFEQHDTEYSSDDDNNSRGQRSNSHAHKSSNFVAFTTPRLTSQSSQAVLSLTREQRDDQYTHQIFYDTCAGGHGTGDIA